jgi:hypothetical protein
MIQAKRVLKAVIVTRLKQKAASAVNMLAAKLNTSVAEDSMSLLLAKKEKLALKKISLLAQLEQIEKDLFSTNEQLKNVTVEALTEVVA